MTELEKAEAVLKAFGPRWFASSSDKKYVYAYDGFNALQCWWLAADGKPQRMSQYQGYTPRQLDSLVRCNILIEIEPIELECKS